VQPVLVQQIPHTALAIIASQAPDTGYDIDVAVPYSRLTDIQIVTAISIE